MKFGGSSVANAERFRSVAGIVRRELQRKPVLVLSAMGDTTDYLLESAERAIKGGPVTVEQSLELITGIHLGVLQELKLSSGVPEEIRPLLEDLGALLAGISLIGELSERSRDFLVSFGERLCVRVAERYFNSLGIKAHAFDAWEIGVTTSARADLEVAEDSYSKIPAALNPVLKEGIMPVVTGFIAKSIDGFITTLGRGGSDLSATLIGAACNAEEVQVWKDVDGILSSDPRIVPNAIPVANVTYEEAAELAYFGSQVLHPRAMLPCIRTGTPVLVKNSYNPAAHGTRITEKIEGKSAPVRALTYKKNVTLVDIVSVRMSGHPGFLGEVFGAFSRYRISVDMVATSEVSVSLTLDSSCALDELIEELSRTANIEVKKDKAIITIVCDVTQSSRILSQTFKVLENANIQVQMISQGASKVNISFVVEEEQAAGLVKLLHREFFEKGFFE